MCLVSTVAKYFFEANADNFLLQSSEESSITCGKSCSGAPGRNEACAVTSTPNSNAQVQDDHEVDDVSTDCKLVNFPLLKEALEQIPEEKICIDFPCNLALLKDAIEAHDKDSKLTNEKRQAASRRSSVSEVGHEESLSSSYAGLWNCDDESRLGLHPEKVDLSLFWSELSSAEKLSAKDQALVDKEVLELSVRSNLLEFQVSQKQKTKSNIFLPSALYISASSCIAQVDQVEVDAAKMFFIFDLDRAVFYKMDIGLHAKSVADLQMQLQEKYNIPTSNQILIVTGGIKLSESGGQLVHFGAGTEPNPVFLFRKDKSSDVLSSSTPISYVEVAYSMLRSIEKVGIVPPHQKLDFVYHIITELTSHSSRLVKDVCCVVQEQECQQNGWAALLAHLRDCTDSFDKTYSRFKEIFSYYQENQDKNAKLLNSIPEVSEILAKFPVSSSICLSEAGQDITVSRTTAIRGSGRRSRTTSESSVSSMVAPSGFSGLIDRKTGVPVSDRRQSRDSEVPSLSGTIVSSDGTAVIDRTSFLVPSRRNRDSVESEMGVMLEQDEDCDDEDGCLTEHSLLQWINERSKEPIPKYVALAKAGLEWARKEVNFPERVKQFDSLLSHCRSPSTREVLGLNDRLESLQLHLRTTRSLHEKIKRECERYRARRGEVTHPTRIEELLCSLKDRIREFQQMDEILDKLQKSRLDISCYLYNFTSNVISLLEQLQVDHSWMMLYIGNMENTERYFEIVRDVANSPRLFCLALREITRRRSYSTAFKKWSVPLVQQSCSIHIAEVERRSSFRRQLEGHFLTNLFPNLLENPPSHWGKKPRDFDVNIPQLSADYVSRIANAAPQFADLLLQPEQIEAVPVLLQAAGFSSSAPVASAPAGATSPAFLSHHLRASASSLLLDGTLSSSSTSVEVFASAVNTPLTPTALVDATSPTSASNRALQCLTSPTNTYTRVITSPSGSITARVLPSSSNARSLTSLASANTSTTSVGQGGVGGAATSTSSTDAALVGGAAGTASAVGR
ncbi:hypothetical protein FHG87_003050 [Trinorchestia longiramus]|nr:hypothetical protein FHG87_003050 [Trinorchestia longiramus]